MGAKEITTIRPAVEEVYAKPAEGWCATFEIADSEHYVQVVKGTFNVAYPFSDEPADRFAGLASLLPGMEVTEWEAETFATFSHDDCPASDIAKAVDQLFQMILGDGRDTYGLDVTVEEL
jgi:hypothetical protein